MPGGANISFSASTGKQVTFSYVLATHVLTVTAADPPLPGTGTLQAFWVDQDTLAWPTSLLGGSAADQQSWQLYHSPTAGIFTSDGAVAGGTAVELTYDPAGLTAVADRAAPRAGRLPRPASGRSRPASGAISC